MPDLSNLSVLFCRPVDPNEVERAAAAESGIGDFGEPYPGSVVVDCTECGRKIYLGPRQQEFVKTAPDALVLCPTDIVKYAVAAESHETIDLGNPHEFSS